MSPAPTSLDRFGEELYRAACRTLPGDAEPDAPRASALRRPRVLAGGSLGLAGVAAALLLALSAGGATAPPAFAVTRASDGSVLVHLSSPEGVPGAEAKLASMGIHEYFGLAIEHGAQVAAPLTCSRAPGTSGPTVQVVMDSGVVPAGETGAGTWHLISCALHPGTFADIKKNFAPFSTGSGPAATGNSDPPTTTTGNTGS